MRRTTILRFVVVVGLVGLLLGCGGSSGGGLPSNADLAALVVSAGTLSPAFTAATLAYTVGPAGLLGAGAVTVTPTAADGGATITVDGAAVASGTASSPIPLPIGPTPVMVVVTAADGTTTSTYDVVFTRASPAGQEAYLKASNTEASDNFGYTVAVAGDTLVAGAHFESSNATGVNGNEADNSALFSGAAYVYTRTGTTWSQQAYLKASNTEAGDRFGWSVAVAGDTVVVGARGEASNATGVNGDETDNSAVLSGAAYVFR